MFVISWRRKAGGRDQRPVNLWTAPRDHCEWKGKARTFIVPLLCVRGSSYYV